MNRFQKAGVHVALTAVVLSATTSRMQAQTRPSMAKPIKLVGLVAGQPTGNEFFLRANGQTFRVRPLDKVGVKGLHGGDRVQVWGRPTGLRVTFANVRVVAARASDNPNDYNPAPGTTITDTKDTKTN